MPGEETLRPEEFTAIVKASQDEIKQLKQSQPRASEQRVSEVIVPKTF